MSSTFQKKKSPPPGSTLATSALPKPAAPSDTSPMKYASPSGRTTSGVALLGAIAPAKWSSKSPASWLAPIA